MLHSWDTGLIPVIEKSSVGGRHLNPNRLEVQVGEKSSPLHPELLPGTAAGDGLPPQRDVPVAEMALHSFTAVRAMGTSLRSALQKGSTE